MAAEQGGQSNSTRDQGLTVFEPYEDPPKGTFAKIASFFNTFTQSSKVPSKLTTHKYKMSDVNVRDDTEETSSGQASVRSLPQKNVSGPAGYGVSPDALDKALRTILKGDENENEKNRDFKRYWMPDSAVKECFRCNAKFTVTLRRHHCRLCGQIFCSLCCSESIPGKIVNQNGYVRACVTCAHLYTVARQQNTSTQEESMVTKAMREESEVEEMVVPVNDNELNVIVSPPVPVLSSQSSLTTRTRTGSMLPWEPSPTNSSTDLMPMDTLLSDSSLLGGKRSEKEEKALAIDRLGIQDIFLTLMSPSEGLPLETHRKWLRTYHNSFQANDIVNWLMDKGFASTRSQAVELGQALVDAKMLEVVTSYEQEFKDDSNAILIPLQLQHYMGGSEDGSGMEDSWHLYWRHSGSKYAGSSPENPLNVSSGTPVRRGSGLHVPNNTPRHTSGDGKRSVRKALTPPHDYCIVETVQPAEIFVSDPSKSQLPQSTCSDWEAQNRRVLLELEETAKKHWEMFLRHLLHYEGLDQSWFDIIKPLAVEASHTLQPYSFSQGLMDILQYVKFKKVPGGEKIDCSLYYGEVFTKTVPYKHMLKKIESPKIMLFKCALEVHRSADRLTSLESLILQEEEYMRNWVDRISSFQPDIIVIEESITGVALNMLLDAGITVIHNVKESVMLRLAHCTEAGLIESVKGISLGVTCGNCKQFYIKTYTLPNGDKKNLMFFDECKHSNACSIVLRGGNLAELRKVKRVFKFAIFAAYSNILECRYLWNEFVQPVSLQASLYEDLRREVEDSPLPEDQDDVIALYPCVPVYSAASSNVSPKSSLPEDTDGLFRRRTNELEETLEFPTGRYRENSLFPVPDVPRESLIFTPTLPDQVDRHATSTSVVKTKQHVFLETLIRSLVSFSPCVTFSIPYLIQNGINHGHIWDYIHEMHFWSHKFASESSQTQVVFNKRHPLFSPGRWLGDSLTLKTVPSKYQSFSPLHMMGEGQLSGDDQDGTNRECLSKDSRRLSYVSVTSHPFLSSVMCYSAKSKEFKAMLADFRARSGLEGEPQEFFFPSAVVADQKQSHHIPLLLQAKSTSSPNDRAADRPSVQSPNRKPRRRPVRKQLIRGRDYADDNLRSVRQAFKRLPAVQPDSTLAHASPRSAMELTELTEENAECRDKLQVKLDCMDPYNHQNISLHYSTTCHDSPHYPRFCTAPRNLTLYYYSQNDITLGDFLSRFCFNDAACSVCKLPFQCHQLHIAHDNFVLNITMTKREMSATSDAELIYTWHKCKECDQVTPNNMLSSPALALSFGKFLELKFYSRDYIPRSTGVAMGDSGPVSPCAHSLHHSHLQYFGYQMFEAEFDLCVVSVYEVYIPPMEVKVVKGHIWDGLNWETDLVSISQKINSFFKAVRDRLDEYDIEPMKNEIKASVANCEHEHAMLCRKVVDLQKLVAAGGLSKSYISAQDSLDDVDVASYIARLQDGTVEVKKEVIRAAITWNRKCERLYTTFVSINHLKSFQKSQKSTSETEPDGNPQDDITYSELSTVGSNDAIDLAECLVLSGNSGSVGSPTTAFEKSVKFTTSNSDTSPPSGKESNSDEVQTTTARESQTLAVKQTTNGDGDSPPRKSSSGGPTLQQSDVPPQNQLESRVKTLLRANTVPSIPHVATDGEPAVTKSLRKDRGKLAGSKSDLPIDDSHFGFKPVKKEKVLDRTPFFGKQRYQPIPSPFPASEHYLLEMELEIPVGVFESEPSSIIACALSCQKYRSELEKRQQAKLLSEQELRSQGTSGRTTPTQYTEYTDTPDVATDGPHLKLAHSPHIEVEFGNSYIFFYCKVYFAEQFHSLRQLLYTPGEERFIRSLLRCVHWRARGGKSGSAFCKVVDDRFVLKQIKKAEIGSFCDIGFDYLHYIESAMHEKRPTCLAKILGVYHVRFSNNKTAQSMEGTFLVMENLRYSHSCNHVFDLKGSMRNRFVRTDDSELDNVYQDENFLEYIQTAPLYIHGHSKKILMQALKTDTEFLAKKNVMDYSLLAGVSETSQLIVVGIIDYLRAFTWDKKLEAWIKRDLLVAGSKGQLPTIVSPDLYRRRFIEAMEQYFALIPDKWYNLLD